MFAPRRVVDAELELEPLTLDACLAPELESAPESAPEAVLEPVQEVKVEPELEA